MKCCSTVSSFSFSSLLVFLLIIPFVASADLTPQNGGQVLFDDDLNIVYLADMGLSLSQTFGVANIGVNGEMNWFTAHDYIDAMNAHDGGNGWLGINNWRLPDTVVPDPNCTSGIGSIPSTGRNCVLSEMGHLYYVELGLTEGTNAGTAAEAAGFSNLSTGFPYWSETLNQASAYDFFFSAGQQGFLSRAFSGQIVPVADVAVEAVPFMPWTGFVALGLALYMVVRRKISG